jgi:hypothetical protein
MSATLSVRPKSGYRWLLLSILLTLAFVVLPSRYAVAGGEVSVSGVSLLRDGKSWIPEGVTLVGFVAPLSVAANSSTGDVKTDRKLQKSAAARDLYGEKLLRNIGGFGADLVRFQVSQPGLDPQSEIYSSAYVDDVTDAIKQARQHGFSVIISMQHQARSGLPGQGGLPSASTQRAWATIGPRFKNDRGVMFEIFNEPAGKPTPKRWAQWRTAHQSLIDFLRNTVASQNVLIVNGLRLGRNFDGVPLLEDKTGQLVYGVHPYLGAENDEPSEWDRNFGNLARTRPIIATEWNALGAGRNCNPGLPKLAQSLLTYLRDRRIGIVGWAFDQSGLLLTRDMSKPTNFVNLKCGAGSQNGAGQLLMDHFRSH